MSIYIVPISAKGIVFEDGYVWLRKNEYNRWELPGGKVDIGEQPEATVKRELLEELGFDVEVIKVIHAYILDGKDRHLDEVKGVMVVSYLCKLNATTGKFEIKSEGGKSEFRKFKPEELDKLDMPDFYRHAIWLANAF